MLASSAMLLYGRRKNEFFAGWLYFSGRNADRQSFFCMLLKTLLPHLTISSLARLYYTVLWPRLCRFSFSCVLRHHKLKSSACGCVSSNLACWRASKKRPCCFPPLKKRVPNKNIALLLGTLKVSKSWKQFMVSSILPKNERWDNSRVSNIESDNSQNVGLEDYNNISVGFFPHFTTPSIRISLG